MARPIYTQTIVAMVWDFDRTMIPGYSQEPIFDAYKIDADEFWAEVNALEGHYEQRGLKVGKDTAYLLHMLTYVQEGLMADLTNSRMRELGAGIELCPGMPDFLTEIGTLVQSEALYQHHGISVEHYVVSTGIRQLIEGSPIGPLVKGIWANEFVDQPAKPKYLTAATGQVVDEGPIAQVGYMVDNTSKTRAVFEINKGPGVDVNALMDEEDRRVPIRNMIYIADGPSDVPVFSVVGKAGGRCLGVYQTGHHPNFDGVKRLEDEGRVNSIAPADYTAGTQAYLWLVRTVRDIADRICRERQAFFDAITPPAGHVIK